MWSMENLKGIDDTLSVQLRLALASPLWKDLPYGVQINPRAWDIKILEVQPQRRLCAWIAVPWRLAQREKPPLQFIMLIWHNSKARCLHRRLSRINERHLLGEERQMMFYDALSHAFLAQYQADATAKSLGPDLYCPEWGKRTLQSICLGLRQQGNGSPGRKDNH